MLRKIKLQNSTIILFGIVLIFIGIFLGMYDYFITKKNNTFSEMNLLLYENEVPDDIQTEEVLEDIQEDISEDDDKSDPVEPEENLNENSNIVKYNYVGILEIPKINLKRGFLGLDSKYNNVAYNITIINGSTFPGEQYNNLILAAHSGNCSVCFFDKLYKLGKGDEAYIYYENIKHIYKIVDIYEVIKDGTVTIKRAYDKNCLTLITCTRNSNTKQTVYILEEI